jgi:hypothetical protein
MTAGIRLIRIPWHYVCTHYFLILLYTRPSLLFEVIQIANLACMYFATCAISGHGSHPRAIHPLHDITEKAERPNPRRPSSGYSRRQCRRLGRPRASSTRWVRRGVRGRAGGVGRRLDWRIGGRGGRVRWRGRRRIGARAVRLGGVGVAGAAPDALTALVAGEVEGDGGDGVRAAARLRGRGEPEARRHGAGPAQLARHGDGWAADLHRRGVRPRGHRAGDESGLIVGGDDGRRAGDWSVLATLLCEQEDLHREHGKSE